MADQHGVRILDFSVVAALDDFAGGGLAWRSRLEGLKGSSV
jgi:hypothetical protein